MYYEPKNADAADSVLQVLQAQLEQNRMRQRVRKKSRQADPEPDDLPIPDTPGQRIVYLRKQRKITQKTLADAVGITSSTLSKYETGNCPFRTDLLIRFARELATTADFLLCLTDRANTSDREFPQIPFKTEPENVIRENECEQPEDRLLALFRMLSERHQLLLIDMIRLFCKQVEEDPEYYPEVVFYQMR